LIWATGGPTKKEVDGQGIFVSSSRNRQSLTRKDIANCCCFFFFFFWAIPCDGGQSLIIVIISSHPHTEEQRSFPVRKIWDPYASGTLN
jgi:hypothetical protein